MRAYGFATLSVLVLFLLTGCWSRVELDELAFVQGVAIDLTEDGSEIDLTVQFYKPTSGGKDSSGNSGNSGERFINLKTKGASIFEAVRDVAIHLGRKASWTHMRILVIGEKLAQERDIGEILDFFARDHEPRLSMSVMIGKDRADAYLKTKPFIEASTSQQLREVGRFSYKYAGKTMRISLRDLMLDLKSQTEVSSVPYIYFDRENGASITTVTGLQILRKGKWVSDIPTERIESLLMLIGKYKGGVLQAPCADHKAPEIRKMESVEVESIKTVTEVKITNDRAKARISIKARGYAGELICSSIKSPEEAAKFNQKIKKSLEQDLDLTLQFLQERKLDALGIGNRIFRQDPALWARWKPEWEERFSKLPITVEVEVNVFNTGANIGQHLAN
ncbi:Ger(x)C family spore germination protein [Cohnella faecalis]|uniref:Ger(X)C family spore germination protein n=1 Tax=Cohnella faecalis TaxID=2315694 RepID=A0A398CCH1_9BACL|nr:Ger(x)C family spore germination protein [Cohnella faecalis]RIE00420.1 Ger(x)C family spore germination protein [Cohnella faecalis]